MEANGRANLLQFLNNEVLQEHVVSEKDTLSTALRKVLQQCDPKKIKKTFEVRIHEVLHHQQEKVGSKNKKLFRDVTFREAIVLLTDLQQLKFLYVSGDTADVFYVFSDYRNVPLPPEDKDTENFE